MFPRSTSSALPEESKGLVEVDLGPGRAPITSPVRASGQDGEFERLRGHAVLLDARPL